MYVNARGRGRAFNKLQTGCSANFLLGQMEGGWKEERVSGIEGDCARNELARGSDLLISYFFARPRTVSLFPTVIG